MIISISISIFTISIIIISIFFFFFFFPVTLLSGYETDPGVSGSPASCLKEVTESATPNPLCYPNSYWAEL